MDVKCISVDKRYAEKVIKILKNINALANEYRVTRNGDRVFIPIRADIDYKLLEKLLLFKYEIIDCNPPSRKKIMIKPPSHDYIDNIVIVRENILSYMDLGEIVEVFRRIYPRLRAIYVKTGTYGLYRVPELKLVWGNKVEYIIHKEYGLRFKVLLGKVYFNPRLGEEHHRLANEVRDYEKVFDLFAGIGGFTIHIASLHNVYITANDLNPYCYKLIIENITLNKKRLKGRIIVSNLDAYMIPLYFKNNVYDRVISNLPGEGYKFFKVYDYLLKDNGILHLYLIGKNCDELLEKIPDKWVLVKCKRVLDYAPYIYIHRLDLVKR